MNFVELFQPISSKILEIIGNVSLNDTNKYSNEEIQILVNYVSLDCCAKRMEQIAKELNNMVSIKQISNSEGATVQKSNECIEQINDTIKLLGVYTSILAKDLVNIRSQFENMDKDLSSKLSNLGYVTTPSSQNTGTISIIGKGESWVETKSNDELSDYDNGILSDGSTSVWGRFNKYYSGIRSGTVNCTWYTGKKCDSNGFNLNYFSPGNGKDWYNGIQSTDTYNATKYAGENCLSDLINAKGDPVTNIVVSFPYSYKGGEYGHVLYIDQIVDGNVYYSDNGSPGKRICVTIDEFLAKYKNSGNGSPIGCVHLESK